jgi:enoyl-CoA hydratase/carnithine racemase
MLKIQVKGGIAELLLDHPPVNGLTVAMLNRLMSALRELGEQPDVRAIIIGSALPGRFCGGLDLREFLESSPQQAHEIVRKLYYELYEIQSNLAKPVIAAVTGAVRGGGMSVVITCDMLVAAEDSTFGYPELDVGLLPGIHYNHLPRIVGRHRAFELLFTGRAFGAHEAMAMGLVSEVVPTAQVLDKAREIAAIFALKSPHLMRLGKRAFARLSDNGYRQAAESAVDLISTVLGTRDCNEGLKSFVEKRKPKWEDA